MKSELTWQDFALCKGLDTNLFFEEYEEVKETADAIDEMCLHCPVFKECNMYAIDNKLTGVWGGIYYENGEVSESKNSHKTTKTWEKIRERLTEDD